MKPAISLCFLNMREVFYGAVAFLATGPVWFYEVFITLGFLIGLVLLILWRVKQRGKVWCTVSALLLVCSVLFGCIGIYNAYFRPKSTPIDMTEQEITEFCDYLLRDDHFQKEFLPASYASPSVYEQPDYKQPDGEGYKTLYTEAYKYVPCFVSSSMTYRVREYPDAESAQAAFAETANADEANATLVEREDYTVVFAPVKWEAHYFNWNEGFGFKTTIRMACVHDRYIIIYEEEACDVVKPRFYKMAEQELFFDSSYAPFEASLEYAD